MVKKTPGGSAAKPPAPALNMGLLSTIVAATKASNFVYCSDADIAALNASPNGPLVEANMAFRNDQGAAATRATQAGIALIDGTGATGTTDGAAAGSPFGGAPAASGGSTGNGVKPTFKIVVVPLGDKPKRARAEGFGVSKYPFDQLPAPTPEQIAAKQFPSFFVPVSEDLPEPWKSLSSTVNGAQKRLFGTKTGTKEVTRAKRGEGRGAPALLDPNGKKIMETVSVDEWSYSGEFRLDRSDDGAPWDFPGQKGAVIARVK